MKKSTMSGLLLFMFLLGASAHASNIVLLNSGTASGDGLKSHLHGRPESVGSARATVLRQHTTALNVNELSQVQSADTIELQLFDDVNLKAVREKVQTGKNGAMVWTGRTEEGGQAADRRAPGSAVRTFDSRFTDPPIRQFPERTGTVVLVVQNGNVYASIYLGCSIFQVRPLEGGESLIRELKAVPWSKSGSPVLHDEMKIIELVNLERSADGLPPLKYNDRLAAAARSHAQDMALHNYHSHDRLDGRKFWQSVFDTGYPVSKCGENIAFGLSNPEETFEALMSSPGHRVNILDPDFKEIGVGHAVSPSNSYLHFWAQEFGAGTHTMASAQ